MRTSWNEEQQHFSQIDKCEGGGDGCHKLMCKYAYCLCAVRRTLSAAFQDLSALMSVAEDMVKLAHKFRAVSSADASHVSNAEHAGHVYELYACWTCWTCCMHVVCMLDM